jgi:hypothetical protein
MARGEGSFPLVGVFLPPMDVLDRVAEGFAPKGSIVELGAERQLPSALLVFGRSASGSGTKT